jgi:hypothetical protein
MWIERGNSTPMSQHRGISEKRARAFAIGRGFRAACQIAERTIEHAHRQAAIRHQVIIPGPTVHR